MPRYLALIITLMVLFLPGPWHKSFELLFPLIWLLVINRYFQTRRIRNVFYLGLASGATFFFRVEIGLLIIAISIITLIIIPFCIAPYNTCLITRIRKSSYFNNIVIDLGTFIISTILVFLPYLIKVFNEEKLIKSIFFYWHEVFSGLVAADNPYLDSLSPITDLLSYSYNANQFLSFALLVFGLLYITTFFYLGRLIIKKNIRRHEILLGFIFIVGLATLYQVYSQPDLSHLLQAAPYAFIVGSFLWHQLHLKNIENYRSGIKRRYIYIGSTLFHFFLYFTFLILFACNTMHGDKDFYYTGSFKIRQDEFVQLNLDRAGVLISPDIHDDIVCIVNYIQKQTNQFDGILALPYMPMFNFLTERENPVFHDIYFPHTVGTAENQKKIIDEVSQKNVVLIILSKGILDIGVQNRADREFNKYAKHIVLYLKDHYEIVKEKGPFLVLIKKGLAKS